MEYKFISENEVEITCDFEELCIMDLFDKLIWAAPTPLGKAMQLYVGEHPQWRDDFVIAGVSEFCDAEGWTSLGWEDMDQETRSMVASDQTTIRVPRYRR